jgi:hypothetical protein
MFLRPLWLKKDETSAKHNNLYIDHFRAGLRASTAVLLRPSLLRDIARRGLAVGYRCSILSLEDGTQMLSRNVSAQLPTHATQHPRRAKT